MTQKQFQANPNQSPMSLRDWAVKRAKILVGCYRKSDAADPETYAAAVVAVLMRWPVDVITSVTEPATGIPSKIKWLPSIAEITEACEECYEPTKARLAAEKTRKQLAAPVPRLPTADELERLRREYPQYFPVPGSKCDTRHSCHSENERREAQAILDRHAAEARQAQQRKAAE